MGDFTVPDGWSSITTIDAHTEGEPLRVVLEGFPELEGDTMLARRRDARTRFDVLRTTLMWEPRGHADMYGCLLTPPVTQGADFGVLFLHNAGFSTMCGHGIIAITKIAVETGIVDVGADDGDPRSLKIDTPAGLVTARPKMADGGVSSVTFRNVASYVDRLDAEVDVPGLGRIRYDLAFGGAYYAYVQADDLGVRCRPGDLPALVERAMAVKRAVMALDDIRHPEQEDLGFLYGTIVIGPPEAADAHSRNVCVFADGEVDRCPTGTGVSGRAALHFARGEIGIGDTIVIESVIGTRFTVSIADVTTFGGRDAVVPEVEGRAWITGRHTFLVDPDDPLADGFLLK